MSNLDALRARIGAATGPDDQIDDQLVRLLAPEWEQLSLDGHINLTASVDDALALVERLLPGFPREWAWRLFTIPGAPPEVRYEASVFKPWRGAAFDWRKSAPTAPLAILAALLAALPASTKEMNDV